jgi:hypothetical protein
MSVAYAEKYFMNIKKRERVIERERKGRVFVLYIIILSVK